MKSFNPENTDKEQLLLFFKDWNDSMTHGFNNKPLPDEYPRTDLGNPMMNGKLLCFWEFSKYCKEQGII